MHIEENKFNDCFKEFQEKALAKFGAFNKNDYEVLLFHLFKEYGDLSKMSPFQISIDLKIPEAKVKRLIYESEIVYGSFEKEKILTEFLDILLHSKFVADDNGKKVTFAIQNKYLRSAIQSEFISLGYYADGSFNSDVVVVHYQALFALLQSNKKFKFTSEQLIEDCKKAMALDKNAAFSWKEVLQKFANSTATEIPKLIRTVVAPTSSITDFVSLISQLMKE